MSNAFTSSNSSHNLRRAVATALALAAASFACASLTFAAEEEAADKDDVAELSDLEVTEDPLRALSQEPSASSFGFSKPLLETPRTVSFVSEEQISLLGIASADDLTRVVPGVYTNRRWGYQGGVDIRGTSADIYFRGMKRLQLQGHARTSLSGMDGIEVVKGPPSPIFGMGRIGGYMNLTPKAGRAKTGSYLTEAQGFVEVIGGSWDHAEASFGIGGPMRLGEEKTGGYYLYGLLEDSGSWVEPVNVKQKILQGATSIDNAIGPFRLEFGGQYQNSNTAGAYMNRATQALIDDGIYVTGTPLVNLDTNGDGQVGFRETHLNSPVRGNVIAGNQPLSQRFAWPTIRGTTTLQTFEGTEGFDKVPGIPQTMLNYLNAHPEVNCAAANYMRTLPAGGPVPISGQLPVGFVLNPCDVGTTKVNPRRGAYEAEQDAQVSLAFLDLVYDPTPDFTVKNQMFYDRLETWKNSQLPYGETQSIWALEDKITVTKKIPSDILPEWLSINSLGSINHRITSAWTGNGGGDFDFRNDAMAGNGDLIVNASFWNNRDNATYETGAPKTTSLQSKYTETGVGMLFDMDVFRKTNLILGARYDWADAESTDRYRFSETCTGASPCTSANAATGLVGMWLPAVRAESSDKGPSWSASLSHQLPYGIRPYVTLANASIVLDGPNNTLDRATVTAPGGFIGEAELKEVGIKASLFGGKVLVTTAGFEQVRTDVSNPLDPTAAADVTSTETRGVEAEIKWVPMRDLFVSAYAVHQTVDYIFATSANIEVDGRQLGFQDVIDPVTGAVLYPAEAFVYGGRLQVVLPEALRSQYLSKNGNPETQFGLNVSYQITKHIGITLGANRFSKIPVTRISAMEIPAAEILNFGATWQGDGWKLQFNGNNILDERYYRPRNGDTVAGLVSSMPGRGWTLGLKHDFR
jgi:iron complex outermembrane recepter protein